MVMNSDRIIHNLGEEAATLPTLVFSISSTVSLPSGQQRAAQGPFRPLLPSQCCQTVPAPPSRFTHTTPKNVLPRTDVFHSTCSAGSLTTVCILRCLSEQRPASQCPWKVGNTSQRGKNDALSIYFRCTQGKKKQKTNCTYICIYSIYKAVYFCHFVFFLVHIHCHHVGLFFFLSCFLCKKKKKDQ